MGMRTEPEVRSVRRIWRPIYRGAEGVAGRPLPVSGWDRGVGPDGSGGTAAVKADANVRVSSLATGHGGLATLVPKPDFSTCVRLHV